MHKQLEMLCRHRLAVRGLRRLSTTGKQTPSKGDGGDAPGVKEPAISLAFSDVNLSSPPISRLSTPLSYYLDTHAAVLQLQEAG